MKYDIKNLLKIFEYGEALCASAKIGQLYTSRTIRAVNELEELEAVLATPQRKDKDIAKHMKLIKDIRLFYTEQLANVETIRRLANNIEQTAETEYSNLFEAIKA